LASALLVGACAAAGGTTATRGTPGTPSVPAAAPSCPEERVTTAAARGLVERYCVSCHSATGAAGEDYDFRSDGAIVARRRNIEAKLRLQVMPPPSAPQPSDVERTALRCWAKE